MKQLTAVLLLPLLISSALANKANKHKPWIETEYQGIVMENDNTVLLNPPLFALDKDAPLHYAGKSPAPSLTLHYTGEVCGFRVHGGGGSVPFEAVVLDKSTGEGLIRAKEPLDCEAQREHSFTIQAYDCNIKNSEVLDFRRQRLYRFSVTAYDCGKKRAAQDSEVQIEVKPTCKPAWTVPCRKEQNPGPRPLLYAPSRPHWSARATAVSQCVVATALPDRVCDVAHRSSVCSSSPVPSPVGREI
ncbi:UNVERIFIED_CONTAM: hypothetical protein FKN15_025646 [Acipenser sinensis]